MIGIKKFVINSGTNKGRVRSINMNQKISNVEEKVKELTVLLLYLTSWDEKIIGKTIKRSWKGYDFDILNELENIGVIYGGKKSKSVCFTEEGNKVAEKLLQKYMMKE